MNLFLCDTILGFESNRMRIKAYYYLKDMLISHYNPSGASRSKYFNNLEVLRARGAYGSIAFSICGPRLWSKLPCPLKNSTKLETLKTHI